MAFLRFTILAVGLITAVITPALAHSLDEVDQNLRDSEKYFEPIDSPHDDVEFLAIRAVFVSKLPLHAACPDPQEAGVLDNALVLRPVSG